MKKLLLSSILVLSASLFFTACTKEGPEGPAGSTGPAGPAGPVGNNAITVKNITISSWTSYSGGLYYRGTATVAEITNNIVNAGAVLAYQNNSGTLNALPFTLSDFSVSYRFFFSLNTFTAENSSLSAGPTPGSTNYRIIIIPGALGARSASGVGGSNHSLEELQQMSYTEACSALGVMP